MPTRLLRSSSGFTLIELMTVMALIVILASVSLTMYSHSVTRAKEAVLKEDLYRLREAINQYYADKNTYPASLEALVDDKYIRALPEDPFTRSADTWQTEQAPPDASNPSADAGVYDVKSGSDQQSLDGTPYSEW